MCGIIGIVGTSSTKELITLLSLLTHRGQEAAGILWTNGEGESIDYQTSKTFGTPASIIVGKREIKFGLGSTRYPTFKRSIQTEDLECYTQPFVRSTNFGSLGLVHNGNITNVNELTKESYLSDTEFICDLLANKINSENGDLCKAVKGLFDAIDGAFSIIGIYEKTIFCFRDPQGIRPLICGRKEDGSWIIASESLVLDQAGCFKERMGINPGELITFDWQCTDDDISIKRFQLVNEEHAHCFFEFVYFANPVSEVEGQSVYETRLRLGETLAKEVQKRGIEIDFVIPIPDTSRIAAQRIGEILKKPVREAILKNRYFSKRTFLLKSEKSRQEAIHQKYFFVRQFIENKHLLLVDDSIVRGITSKTIVSKLQEYGVEKVYLAVTAPPQIRACYYGIDISNDEELIAKNRSIAEIADLVGVDDIIYQNLGDLFEAIRMKNLCTACVTGRYPTKNGKRIREKILRGEINLSQSHYEQ